MLIEMDSATDFKNKVYETRFGKIIEGTTYGNYAVENEFLLDNDEYVEKKPNTAIYQLTLAYNGKYYGLYYDLVRQLMYCTERNTLNGGLAVAVKVEFHCPQTSLFQPPTKSSSTAKIATRNGRIVSDKLEIRW